MRDLFSAEAEHGILGAMMMRPELIDVLSEDLQASDFYFPAHQDMYRSILALKQESKGIDFLTVAERMQPMENGETAFAYTAEIVKNTPSVANAKSYAQIVLDRAIERRLLQCGTSIHEIACSDMDIEGKLSAVQSEVAGIETGGGADDVVMAADVLLDQVGVWEERHDRYTKGETLIGISTGLKDLDDKLGGLQPEQLIIIAGRPGMGKTTLAMGFCADAAIRQKKSVLTISLEMSKGQLIDRLMASEGRIPLSSMKNGTACQEHAAAMSSAAMKLKTSKLAIADKAGLTINRIRAMARRHKARHGLDLLMVDYMQLLESDGNGGNRTEDVSAMSRGAKLLARELGIPVLMLSQLNRSLEQRPNKRPVNSDLRESGAIEQDADVIMFVYRDEIYHENSEYKGIAEVIIGKGRDIETGTVRAAFIGQYNRFENLAAGWVEPDQDNASTNSKVTSMTGRYAKKDKF